MRGREAAEPKPGKWVSRKKAEERSLESHPHQWAGRKDPLRPGLMGKWITEDGGKKEFQERK